MPVFVDTNVFLYARDDADPDKQRAARLWQAELWKNRRGRISYQVLHEFYANAMQKWPPARESIRADVRDLLAWQPVIVDDAVLERAWKIQDRHKLSFWDSLIVAAAQSAACHWLLTEDLHAGQNLDGVTVINPFMLNPDQLPQTAP